MRCSKIKIIPAFTDDIDLLNNKVPYKIELRYIRLKKQKKRLIIWWIIRLEQMNKYKLQMAGIYHNINKQSFRRANVIRTKFVRN